LISLRLVQQRCHRFEMEGIESGVLQNAAQYLDASVAGAPEFDTSSDLKIFIQKTFAGSGAQQVLFGARIQSESFFCLSPNFKPHHGNVLRRFDGRTADGLILPSRKGFGLLPFASVRIKTSSDAS